MKDEQINKTVYIAGPYTQGDVALNVREAITTGDAVAEIGYIPYIPHLSHFWHLVKPREYDWWLAYDLKWLEKCDYLIRMAGPSSGADKEVIFARELGIYCFQGSEHQSALDEFVHWDQNLTRPLVGFHE